MIVSTYSPPTERSSVVQCPIRPYSVPYFFRDRGGWNPLTTYTLFPIFLPYAISSVGSLSTV